LHGWLKENGVELRNAKLKQDLAKILDEQVFPLSHPKKNQDRSAAKSEIEYTAEDGTSAVVGSSMELDPALSWSADGDDEQNINGQLYKRCIRSALL
jgi:hypothetical protein